MGRHPRFVLPRRMTAFGRRSGPGTAGRPCRSRCRGRRTRRGPTTRVGHPSGGRSPSGVSSESDKFGWAASRALSTPLRSTSTGTSDGSATSLTLAPSGQDQRSTTTSRSSTKRGAEDVTTQEVCQRGSPRARGAAISTVKSLPLYRSATLVSRTIAGASGCEAARPPSSATKMSATMTRMRRVTRPPQCRHRRRPVAR